MNDDINLIWQDYVSIKAFDKRMVRDNFVDGHVPDYLANTQMRKEYMSDLTYKSASKELKLLMTPSSYSNLSGAFRAYKYKKNKSLATINIDSASLSQLKKVQRELGLDDHDNSFSDVILWLTSPPVRREDDTLQALFNANNKSELIEFGDNPTSSLMRQLSLFQARLCFNDQQLLKKIVEHSFVSGWTSKKGTRSDSPERIQCQLELNDIHKIVSEYKVGE